MFGLEKLKDLKKNAEEVKIRLDNISVEGTSGNGLIVVRCSGSRKILSIQIADRLHRTTEKDQLEKLIAEACNNAMLQADMVAQSEMRSIMPSIPGLEGLL